MTSDEYKSILFVIALLFAGAFFINFIADWQRGDEDTQYKQDMVDNYDSFYSDCTDYLSENKIIDTAKAYELHKKEIIENTAFQKELTDNERILSAVCKSLDEFSKDESKEVIYDLDHPVEEDPPMEDCDMRGCTYY